MRTLQLLLFGAVGCAHPDQHHDGPAGEAHHHGHRFADAEQWAARFEDPKRDAWQKPEEVIAALELTLEMLVADIGSATGYFPVRLARAVPQGRVWGVDVEPEMVRYLKQRAAREGLDNLESVLGNANSSQLPEPVDRILIVNTYHHIADRQAYFRRLKQKLRPGGRLCIVDFKKGELPVGPPDSMKLSLEEVETELGRAGYALHAAPEILPFQYIAIFVAR